MVLQVARIVGVTDEQKRLMGVGSGLELVTLPHGRQLRQDLLERYMNLTHFIHLKWMDENRWIKEFVFIFLYLGG